MRRQHKRTILIFLVLIYITDIRAQTKKKDVLLNIGAYSGYGYPDGLPSTETSGIPAMSAGGEYFLNKYIAVGSYITYTYVFDKFVGLTPEEGYKDVWRGWDIGIKTSFHFNPLLSEKHKNTDVYITGFGGYTYRALRYDKKTIYRDSLNYAVDASSIGGILGLRYFSKKIGLYGELGKSRKWFVGGGVNFTINSK